MCLTQKDAGLVARGIPRLNLSKASAVIPLSASPRLLRSSYLAVLQGGAGSSHNMAAPVVPRVSVSMGAGDRPDEVNCQFVAVSPAAMLRSLLCMNLHGSVNGVIDH